MYKYQNNAFRVLGLLPSASMQEVMSRVSEIKVKKSLGFDIVYEYDFPWMGPLDRSDENVINALQRLEDPFSKLKEEVFWFWIESEDDKRALEYLSQNKRQAAHEIWRKIASDSTGDKLSRAMVRACVNEAVLAHSSVIAKESDVKYQHEEFHEERIVLKEESEVLCCPDCQKVYEKEWKICLKCGVSLVMQRSERKEKLIKTRGNSVLNESHWKNWRFAVGKYTLLYSSDIFWLEVGKLIKAINDPRLPESRLEDLKKDFLSEVTDPNLEFISRALSSKDYERTKWHSNLLNGLNLPSLILKAGFNRTLNEHIVLLNKYSSDASKAIGQFKDDASKDLMVGFYSKFSDQIKDIVYEGNLVDINCISDFALARDNVAGVLRSLSVEFHNRFHDYKRSYDIIGEAVECAASTYLKQRFEKDVEAVRRSLVSSESNKAAEVPQKSIWTFLKSIPWWVWVIGFFILVSIFSNDNSSKSSSSNRSSTYKSPSTYQRSSDTSLAALKTRIMALKTSVDAKESELEDLSAKIKLKENEMAELKSAIESIESRYKYSTYGVPSYIESDYENKIDTYNNILIPAYNALIERARELYAEYEQEVKTHDGLVETYNSKIR